MVNEGGAGGRKPGAGSGPRTRADRLRAALRENLRRRKAQAKGRSVAEKPGSGGSHDSAGIVGETVPDTAQDKLKDR
jgi:hypothetical protein